MKPTNAAHAASYAEFACCTFTMKHAKNYLRDCGMADNAAFADAMKARTKAAFLDAVWTIQANERWSNK